MATLKAFDMCLSFRRMTVGPLDRETCQPSCVFVAFFWKGGRISDALAAKTRRSPTVAAAKQRGLPHKRTSKPKSCVKCSSVSTKICTSKLTVQVADRLECGVWPVPQKGCRP